MITYNDIDPNKKAFVFELDNVLFPERDYLLQIYYLFANFLEYTEAFPPAADLTSFLKKAYENNGPELIFEKAREVFGFDEKYRDNFQRLHIEGRLPLKLLLYKEVLTLLQEIVIDRKEIYIVTDGNPALQLNKIRQTEWNGLENYLRVYFTSECAKKPSAESLLNMMKEHQLTPEEVIVLGTSDLDAEFAKNAGVDYLRLN